MSTTRTTHPPRPAPVRPRPVATPAPRPVSRPNVVDRLALRLGLLLITYGRRHRVAPTSEQVTRLREAERFRQVHERAWERAHWNVKPR